MCDDGVWSMPCVQVAHHVVKWRTMWSSAVQSVKGAWLMMVWWQGGMVMASREQYRSRARELALSMLAESGILCKRGLLPNKRHARKHRQRRTRNQLCTPQAVTVPLAVGKLRTLSPAPALQTHCVILPM